MARNHMGNQHVLSQFSFIRHEAAPITILAMLAIINPGRSLLNDDANETNAVNLLFHVPLMLALEHPEP